MDSQPSGSNSELLFVETEEVYFSIKGSSQAVGHGEAKSLVVMVDGKGRLKNYFTLFLWKSRSLSEFHRKFSGSYFLNVPKEYLGDINQNIYFKEYTNYEIIIERKNKTTIEFYHENPNIRNKVTPTGRGGNILSGIINFRGDIGYSDFYVRVNGKIHMKINIEVLPSKIDYKEDYKAILNDVNEEIYNLAYGFLSRTYLGTKTNNKRSNSYTEFYSILSDE